MKVSITLEKNVYPCCMPRKGSAGATGYDVYANEAVVIQSLDHELVPLGFRIAAPQGVDIQLRPRSSLALRSGVTLLNSPGTIDSDYRGEVCAILMNHSAKAFTVNRGDRVAQMVFAAVQPVDLVAVDTLDDTTRGVGGFGSTGR